MGKKQTTCLCLTRVFSYVGRNLLYLIVLTHFFLLSCSKDKCQTWEYYDECYPKVARSFDTGPFLIYGTHFKAELCGHELDGIFAGYAVVRTDDTQKTITRHYVKKVN